MTIDVLFFILKKTHLDGIYMKVLAELLIEDKIITKKQLNKALEKQDENGGLLGMILLSLGYINREVLMNYIAREDQFHIDL